MKKMLLLLTIAALMLPAVASANSPKFPNHKIVVGRSMAGVSLGMSVTKAIAAWGGNTGCNAKSTVCGWSNGSIDNFTSAEVFFKAHKVVGMLVETYVNAKQTPVCKAPLSKLKTSKKIGLCSTEKAVKRAYPKVKTNGGFVTLGKGKTKTEFLFPGTGGATSRSVEIEIGEVSA